MPVYERRLVIIRFQPVSTTKWLSGSLTYNSNQVVVSSRVVLSVQSLLSSCDLQEVANGREHVFDEWTNLVKFVFIITTVVQFRGEQDSCSIVFNLRNVNIGYTLLFFKTEILGLIKLCFFKRRYKHLPGLKLTKQQEMGVKYLDSRCQNYFTPVSRLVNLTEILHCGGRRPMEEV